MRYRVTKLTPEFRALSYSLLIVNLSLYAALYFKFLSIEVFFYYMIVTFIVSLIVGHYRADHVDESAVRVP